MIEVGFKVEKLAVPGEKRNVSAKKYSEFVVIINFSEKWFDTIK
jgi:hypothetical protein